jgi:hypothetical protein
MQNAALQFQKHGANPFAAPALKGRLADIPARGKGSLVEMDDFHAGLRTGWWESMKALFRPQAKSVCSIDADAGSIELSGIELTATFSMNPTIRI